MIFTLAKIVRPEKFLGTNNLRTRPRRLGGKGESFFKISRRVTGTRVLQKSEGDFHATSESHGRGMTRNLSAPNGRSVELAFDLPDYYHRRNYTCSRHVC